MRLQPAGDMFLWKRTPPAKELCLQWATRRTIALDSVFQCFSTKREPSEVYSGQLPDLLFGPLPACILRMQARVLPLALRQLILLWSPVEVIGSNGA